MNQPSSSRQNTRRSRRHPPKGTTRVRCHANAMGLGANIALRVFDLSETGARLIVRTPLKPGQEIEVTLEGIGLVRPVKVVANVIWTAPGDAPDQFIAGVQFQKALAFGDWQAMART